MEHPENNEKYKGLKVNKGVMDVPSVNPYFNTISRPKHYTTDDFINGILQGNTAILSQTLRLLERAR